MRNVAKWSGGSCRNCGRTERAHSSLENQRTVFHELPQDLKIILSLREDRKS
jgi:hypothetical protein